jgi:hypothetical protein
MQRESARAATADPVSLFRNSEYEGGRIADPEGLVGRILRTGSHNFHLCYAGAVPRARSGPLYSR